MGQSESELNKLSFQEGIERLESIAAELENSEQLSIDQVVDLFAEGKALGSALNEYLTEHQERLEAIERGENLPNVSIVAQGE